MFETQNVGDALRNVEPRLHPRRKNRALIQANCEAIYAARDRGCTWADIAMALSEAGLTVSPNALRLAMNEKSRDLKKYPRKRLAERKIRCWKSSSRQQNLADSALRAGKAVLDAIQNRASVGPQSSLAL
jgi:hypothetical protein